LFALLVLLLLTSCRQYMADQPRYKPYQESGFFPDGTSARPLPEGVIPQGFEKVQSSPVFPFPVTMDVLKRGQERFNIFCTPCHDHMGTGQGMAVRRGFREGPPSFHTDELRTAPPGHFFDVITHGKGVMPAYAYQIHARDRWAIVAYIRALQLSFDAPLADVPPDELSKLEREKQ
jgi:mono/diheme cytochrome c family protein